MRTGKGTKGFPIYTCCLFLVVVPCAEDKTGPKGKGQQSTPSPSRAGRRTVAPWLGQQKLCLATHGHGTQGMGGRLEDQFLKGHVRFHIWGGRADMMGMGQEYVLRLGIFMYSWLNSLSGEGLAPS